VYRDKEKGGKIDQKSRRGRYFVEKEYGFQLKRNKNLKDSMGVRADYNGEKCAVKTTEILLKRPVAEIRKKCQKITYENGGFWSSLRSSQFR